MSRSIDSVLLHLRNIGYIGYGEQALQGPHPPDVLFQHILRHAGLNGGSLDYLAALGFGAMDFDGFTMGFTVK